MRILTNYFNNKENLSLNIEIDIIDRKNPLIISTKNYSFILQFNKLNLLINSNIFFLKVRENIFLNQRISISNYYHHCLNNQTNDFILIDSTNTFDIDQNFNLIIKKYLNTKQQNIYHLILQQKQDNSTDQVSTTKLKQVYYMIRGVPTTGGPPQPSEILINNF